MLVKQASSLFVKHKERHMNHSISCQLHLLLIRFFLTIDLGGWEQTAAVTKHHSAKAENSPIVSCVRPVGRNPGWRWGVSRGNSKSSWEVSCVFPLDSHTHHSLFVTTISHSDWTENRWRTYLVTAESKKYFCSLTFFVRCSLPSLGCWQMQTAASAPLAMAGTKKPFSIPCQMRS